MLLGGRLLFTSEQNDVRVVVESPQLLFVAKRRTVSSRVPTRGAVLSDLQGARSVKHSVCQPHHFGSCDYSSQQCHLSPTICSFSTVVKIRVL